MPDRPDTPLAVILRELAWTIHKRSPDRAGVGPLPTIEVALLKQIVDSPGSTVGELSTALGLRQPNTSAALRDLVDRGLVARVTDERDRRTVRIEPTELGRTEHVEIAGAWANDVATALEQLPEADRAALEGAAGALASLSRIVRGAAS
ncbi:MarR family winged helix-turn-helix transcriptional regulator [Microbacterium sp. GXF7504]